MVMPSSFSIPSRVLKKCNGTPRTATSVGRGRASGRNETSVPDALSVIPAAGRNVPSEYFKRQCWISFDPDESTLRFTAESPLVGADRIIWASDYPHPDAKMPGVVDELRKAMTGLSPEAQRRILGLNAVDLYRLPEPAAQ